MAVAAASAMTAAVPRRAKILRRTRARTGIATTPSRFDPLADRAPAALATINNTEISFRLDVRRLDDRPPLLDFGFLQRAEGFGRLPVARDDFLPEYDEPLTHGR